MALPTTIPDNSDDDCHDFPAPAGAHLRRPVRCRRPALPAVATAGRRPVRRAGPGLDRPAAGRYRPGRAVLGRGRGSLPLPPERQGLAGRRRQLQPSGPVGLAAFVDFAGRGPGGGIAVSRRPAAAPGPLVHVRAVRAGAREGLPDRPDRPHHAAAPGRPVRRRRGAGRAGLVPGPPHRHPVPCGDGCRRPAGGAPRRAGHRRQLKRAIRAARPSAPPVRAARGCGPASSAGC